MLCKFFGNIFFFVVDISILPYVKIDNGSIDGTLHVASEKAKPIEKKAFVCDDLILTLTF